MESRLRAATSVLTASLVAVILSSTTGVAHGQPNDDPGAMSVQARKHLELGLTHYQAKAYEDAIREFRAGYTLDPRPELLFAMAQAERLSGDCRSAIAAYEKFLDSNPPEQQASAAREAIERCTIALGSGMRPSEQPATERARERRPATVLVAAPQRVAPTNDAAVAANADDLRRPWYRDKVGAGLLGAGVATAAVGLGYYVASSSDEAAADEAPTYGEYQDLIARAESRRKIAWTGMAAGTALIGGAAIWYLVRRDDPPPRRPSLGMSVTGNSAAVFYSREF